MDIFVLHIYVLTNEQSKKYTRGVRTPASIFLRYSDGVYAIDADKSHDVQDGILSVLVGTSAKYPHDDCKKLTSLWLQGKSMEKVLTLPPREYEKYLKDSAEKVSEEEKQKPESYAYGRVSPVYTYMRYQTFYMHSANRGVLLDWQFLVAVAAGLLPSQITKESV